MLLLLKKKKEKKKKPRCLCDFEEGLSNMCLMLTREVWAGHENQQESSVQRWLLQLWVSTRASGETEVKGDIDCAPGDLSH